MRLANVYGAAVVAGLIFGTTPTLADPQLSSRAAKLSAALEGTLDSDIGEAGALDQRIEYASVLRRPGRSAEYRRRVALEMQMAAQASAGTRPMRVAHSSVEFSQHSRFATPDNP